MADKPDPLLKLGQQYQTDQQFLRELRETTTGEVYNYLVLQQQLKALKLRMKTIMKRIKLSNKLLLDGGQTAVSLTDVQLTTDASKQDKKGLAQKVWNRIPNLAQEPKLREEKKEEENAKANRR